MTKRKRASPCNSRQHVTDPPQVAPAYHIIRNKIADVLAECTCSQPGVSTFLVLATGQAEDGGIFIYDLLQSSVIPVASAYLPSGSADLPSSRASGFGEKAVCGAAYSVAFNPKQRDLLATGDSKGRVIIWRVSWRLANKRPGEDDGLEQLFKGSASDVSVGNTMIVRMEFRTR